MVAMQREITQSIDHQCLVWLGDVGGGRHESGVALARRATIWSVDGDRGL